MDVLRSAGYTQIEAISGALPDEELKRKIADALCGHSLAHPVDRGRVCPRAQAGRCGMLLHRNQPGGSERCARAGIAVFNAPYSNTRSVAELVLAEAILLLRGVPEKNAVAHRGGWLKSAENAYEIRGKTLGIVGYGSIGTQLSVLAEALGMQVAFYDVVNKLPLGNARQVAKLHDLLAQSDIVSLHVPELPSTEGMIGAAEIAAMKPGGILINAARGTVVDIDALADALKAKKLLGAAIDVFPVEPRTNKDEFLSPCAGWTTSSSPPHRRLHHGSAGQHRHRGGREAGEVQRQRNQHLVRQLP